MAKHDISFRLPARPIKNTDATFKVHSDDELLGTLKVSRGSLEWSPANARKGYHINWEDFNVLMQQEGKR
jgi:nitrogen fixation protein FixH